MPSLDFTKFPVKHPRLHPLIKYFWVLKDDSRTVLNRKLLPFSNLDLILNFSSPIQYGSDDKTWVTTAKSHFRGIGDHFSLIRQTGPIDILGVSFRPAGAYPLLKIPLKSFFNQTVELGLIMPSFEAVMKERLSGTDSPIARIRLLERELAAWVDPDLLPDADTCRLLGAFGDGAETCPVTRFCREYGVSLRQLERHAHKYIGMSPVLLKRLARYRKAVAEMISRKGPSLTEIAFNHGYCDQNHFIREFKGFTGSTPTAFLKDRTTVIEMLNDLT